MTTGLQTPEHYLWGNNYEGWHLFRDEALSVIRESIPPAGTEVWHYHRKAQQVFYILSGTALFETEENGVVLHAGESISVPPGRIHRIGNKTEQALGFLVISAPMAQGDRVEFIGYAPEYRDEVKKLNYEWLEKYFRVEPGDERSLSDPQHEIIAKGGYIYFVRVKGEIIGTVSLLQKQPGVFELGKMAVTEKARGKGIGQKLIAFSIFMARQHGAHTLMLYSNTRLVNAIHLYRKFGFKESVPEPGLYERADIKMTLLLEN